MTKFRNCEFRRNSNIFKNANKYGEHLLRNQIYSNYLKTCIMNLLKVYKKKINVHFNKKNLHLLASPKIQLASPNI